MAADGVNVLAVPQPGPRCVPWVLSQHGMQWEQPHVSGYSDWSWTAQQKLLSVFFPPETILQTSSGTRVAVCRHV